MRVRQRRSEACVVLENLASRGFLAVVLKYGPVWRQHRPGERDPGGQCAQRRVKSNNGAPALGGHLGKRDFKLCKNKKNGGVTLTSEPQLICFPRSPKMFSSLDVEEVSKRGMARTICCARQTFLAVLLLPKLFYPALLVRSLLDPPRFLHYPKIQKKLPEIKKHAVLSCGESAAST